MQRRTLVKSAGLGLVGLFTLPAWANGWNQKQFIASSYFSVDNDALLAEIVETILPETATPGAKSLGVHKLIQKIVADCQGPDAAQKLVANLLKLNSLAQSDMGSNFVDLPTDKKITFIKSFENSTNADMKSFYSQMKRMTIDGYLKSEYVMTNITNYEYAPGRWNACVKVAP